MMTTKENCKTASQLRVIYDLLANRSNDILNMTSLEYAEYLRDVERMENLAIKLDRSVGQFKCNPFNSVACSHCGCQCYDPKNSN